MRPAAAQVRLGLSATPQTPNPPLHLGGSLGGIAGGVFSRGNPLAAIIGGGLGAGAGDLLGWRGTDRLIGEDLEDRDAV